MTLTAYVTLFAATALYAVLLARFKHLIEPEFTWLEVVVGIALCLTAPALLARRGIVAGWQSYETLVWWAFVVGGVPIVLWQLGRAKRTWRRVERRIRERDGKSDPEALAEECGERTQDDL